MASTLLGYNIVNEIGRGAASTIYAVTDPAGQLFTLKHVVRQSEADDRFVQQLQNEYDMSRLFRHPGLRKVIELKIPRKMFSNKVTEAGLVLEWVDGRPLDDNPPGELPVLLGMFAHCAAALASLHKLHLVHCDFKPANVLVGEDGKIRIIDFGHTCRTGTSKYRMQGTPDFIAPEQVKCAMVDSKTDIYCFGASLYWALTGKKVPTYFTVGKTEHDIIKMQKFPAPAELNPAVPKPVSDLLMHCLRYNPDRRPADMITILGALQAFVA